MIRGNETNIKRRNPYLINEIICQFNSWNAWIKSVKDYIYVFTLI